MLRSPLLITVALLTVSTFAPAAQHTPAAKSPAAENAEAADPSDAGGTAGAEDNADKGNNHKTGDASAAKHEPDAPTVAELDKASQELISDILELQGQLLALKRDIHYPPLDRWTVFVTRKTGEERVFTLEHIGLMLDGKRIAGEQYSANERRALRHGGADRLHLGVLPRGRHHAKVTIVGEYGGEPFRRTQALIVDKTNGPRILVLQVRPRVATRSDAPAQPGVTTRHLDDLR